MKKTKEKYISEKIINTIIGFMNSVGGILLVGIDDNKNIIGISEEKKNDSNKDKFSLALKTYLELKLRAKFL